VTGPVEEVVDAAHGRITALREALTKAAVDDQRVWSVDGVTFSFDIVTDEPVPVGAHVELALRDGSHLLGQVTAVVPAERPGPSLTLDDIGLGPGTSAEVRLPIRSVAGSGTLLATLADDGVAALPRTAFDAATLRPAPDAAVAAAIRPPADAGALRLGRMLGRDVPIDLDPAGFARHTFVCGQSGSGKTYAIGKLLEELLLHTRLPVVALDPNSDYVTLTVPRDRDETGLDAATYERRVGRLRDLADDVPVFGAGRERLGVLFGRLRPAEQAIVLGLDPVADSRTYGTLLNAAAAAGPDATLSDLIQAASSLERGQALADRVRNLGIDRWDVWSAAGETTVGDRLAAGWRAVVFDLGSVATAPERSVVAAAVLGALWEHRYEREPRLVLIDEAHNVCPASPTSVAQAAGAEVVRAIAAEGRKFGLYLLLATQEPHKVHPDVLSQCSNLVLMRTTSAGALDTLRSAFADVPPDVLGLAPSLQRGEGVVAGPVTPHPLLFRTGARLTRDGGRDVPPTWATEVPS
jgi:hypothetical protein